ncbi:MAG: glycosyltransferase family 25 protein, partial [Chitinophagaceae bacterium]|nr:glycosyltransferase family 25 protein [Chitinophagaceae bacterium]
MSANVFQPLNNFFPHIFVVSLQRATERKAKLEPLLQGLRFEYFEAFDKRWLDTAERMAAVYDEAKARQLHRYGKPMGTGPIACSISHLRIYERMLAENISHALILEDDAVPQLPALAHWAAMQQ